MKKSSVCLVPVFLLLLLFSSYLGLIKCGDLVEEICEKTPFYDLCVSSFGSDSQSSKAEDAKGLASIMSNIVLSNAADTLNYIQGLISQTKDPQLEKPLAFCAESYIPVVKYTLPQAIDAMSKGQFAFANYGISDAAKQVDACEKNFSASSDSPLTDRNKLVHHLCDIAVAIITVLLKG